MEQKKREKDWGDQSLGAEAAEQKAEREKDRKRKIRGSERDTERKRERCDVVRFL